LIKLVIKIFRKKCNTRCYNNDPHQMTREEDPVRVWLFQALLLDTDNLYKKKVVPLLH
jgi:hypothetical protein